jgi:hypothetical protein
MTTSPTPSTTQGIAEAPIAETVNRAMSGSTIVPSTVAAHVTGSHVTLTGQVDSYIQRDAAEETLERLAGGPGHLGLPHGECARQQADGSNSMSAWGTAGYRPRI